MSIRLLLRLWRESLRAPWVTGPPSPRRLLLLAFLTPTFLLLQTVHCFFFWLDDLLYPGYRDIEPRAPVFIVGMPRSGTTFLHHLLAHDDRNFTTARLWELILAPSICQRRIAAAAAAIHRRLGSPLQRLNRLVRRSIFAGLDDVHPVRFDDAEEDYLALLPVFACFILVVAHPHHPAVWRMASFDQAPERERRAILDFYRSLVQRHLYFHGTRRTYLAKNPSFLSWIDSLNEAFPGCRLIFTAREPEAAIPSLLSSLDQGTTLFGYRASDAPYRTRFTDMLEAQTRHAVTRLTTLPVERHCSFAMSRLVNDIEGSALEIYRRFGLVMDERMEDRVAHAAARSLAYRSSHAYGSPFDAIESSELAARFAHLDPLLHPVEEMAS